MNEFGYFEGNTPKWLTTRCRRIWNMDSSSQVNWCVCVICFCFVQFFSSVRWVHSIFGLAAWMEMRYKTQYNGERNAHRSEWIVPFVYVFALGWQNNSTEFFSLCSRLHSSSLRHSKMQSAPLNHLSIFYAGRCCCCLFIHLFKWYNSKAHGN